MMTTLRQIDANQLNAAKSTGPRSDQGKQRSRLNAVRHGLTAETVVSVLEDAADYAAFEDEILADYAPITTTEHELVARLASVLWRLRRSSRIEAGLLQIQGELLAGRRTPDIHRNGRRPEWYDELNVAAVRERHFAARDEIGDPTNSSSRTSDTLAYCFLQVVRLQYGAFDVLTRYETGLWRQAAQLFAMLRGISRR